MISIISCTRNHNSANALKKNIVESIGLWEGKDFEFVFIDNNNRKNSIFQAYNIGVQKSIGDILCFVHDDVSFITHGWGEIVNQTFYKHENIGCLGVAGTHFMADTPASWWHSHFTSIRVLLDNNGNVSLAERHEIINDRHLTTVASVDGLWFCIRKDLFKHISFDEVTFSGFHCYDSDICMQILQIGYTISVTFDILVKHKAVAEVDMSYFNAIKAWHNKWKSFLPLQRGISITVEDIERFTGLICDSVENEEKYTRIKTSKAFRIGTVIQKKSRFLHTIFKPNYS